MKAKDLIKKLEKCSLEDTVYLQMENDSECHSIKFVDDTELGDEEQNMFPAIVLASQKDYEGNHIIED
jgi:hypothetical protein